MTQSGVRIDDLDLPEAELDGDAYLSDPVTLLQRCRQASWIIRTPAAFGIQVLSHEVAVQMIPDMELGGEAEFTPSPMMWDPNGCRCGSASSL